MSYSLEHGDFIELLYHSDTDIDLQAMTIGFKQRKPRKFYVKTIKKKYSTKNYLKIYGNFYIVGTFIYCFLLIFWY